MLNEKEWFVDIIIMKFILTHKPWLHIVSKKSLKVQTQMTPRPVLLTENIFLCREYF